ncbi:MAG TPA: hypothetical protein VIL74_01000 [Pyrinomonadaceae bacterium]|jgi:uncharacterized membrane protein
MEYQSGAVSPVESISEGWNIIKDNYWMYVLMVLVAGVVLIVASLILGTITNMISGAIAGALGAATTNAGDAARVSAAILPQVIAQFVSIFTNIIVVTLSGVLFCGIYKSMARVASGGKADFGDLFGGFEHLPACLVYAVIISLVQFAIGIATLLGFAAFGFSALGMGLAGIMKDGQLDMTVLSGLFMVILAYVLISIVIGLVIGALTTFVFPLIADRNLSGVQALGLSVKSGLANIVGLILLLILCGLMIFAGALPCGLGLPFIAPIYIAALFAAYRRVFGVAGGGNQNYNPPPPPNFANQPRY